MKTFRNIITRIVSGIKRKPKPQPGYLTTEQMHQPCPKCSHPKREHIRMLNGKHLCLAHLCTCLCTEFFGSVSRFADDVNPYKVKP